MKKPLYIVFLPILLLALCGCMTPPYVETDTYTEDGMVQGQEKIYHDSDGGEHVIENVGLLPADETGEEAIQTGTAGDGAEDFEP